MDVPAQSQPEPPKLGFRTLERALEIFRVISHRKEGWSKHGLAIKCGIPDRTMARYLQHLEAIGWIYRRPNGTYLVDPTARVPAGAADHDGIDKTLKRFVQRTRRDVALATLNSGNLVLTHLHKHAEEESLLDDIHPGAVHATAAGKCLIAQLPEDERRRLLLLNGMPRYTAKTITDIKKLERSLEPEPDMVWSAEGEYCDNGACLAILAHPGASYGDSIALTTSVSTAEFEETRDQLVANLHLTLAQLQPVLGPLLPPTFDRVITGRR